MKKIITKFSTNVLLGCMVLLGANYQQIYDTNSSYEIPSETTMDNSSETIENTENAEVTITPNPEEPIVPSIPAEKFKYDTDLIIKAVNPGYTIDGIRDVGEFIELQNVTDTPISLAGYSLHYVNSSGKRTTLFNFSEGSSMVGEFLLLRLARTNDSDLAEITYTTTLAMSSGRLELYYSDILIDDICWSKDADCATAFDSKKPTILVRDDLTGIFDHLETYNTHYNPDQPTLKLPVVDESPDPDETIKPGGTPSNPPTNTKPGSSEPSNTTAQPQCRGIEFSEILSYYTDDASEQFIELYNPTDDNLNLTGCSLRYKKKLYTLSGTLLADGYYTFYPSKSDPSFTLTKNPSSSNMVELLDVDNSIVDALVYIHGQKKSTSYAKFYETDGSELWNLTYLPTPNSANQYQEFRTCPAGKIINPITGNCIKAATSTANSTIADCPTGKYRNPLTGRCKNIESDSTEPKPCAEGYERNPETNRCRKIKSENTGADYALVPTTYSDEKSFTAAGVIIALVCTGIIYIILQFRHELIRMLRKLRQRLHYIRKNLLSRHIGLHRNKKS